MTFSLIPFNFCSFFYNMTEKILYSCKISCTSFSFIFVNVSVELNAIPPPFLIYKQTKTETLYTEESERVGSVSNDPFHCRNTSNDSCHRYHSPPKRRCSAFLLATCSYVAPHFCLAHVVSNTPCVFTNESKNV